MPWVLRGLRNGVVTTRWPAREDAYRSAFRAAVDVRVPAQPTPDDGALEALCPTGAISVSPGGIPALDRGRCILCGRCVERRPDLFAWAPGALAGDPRRDGLVVPAVAETDETLSAVRRDLAERVRRLRRSAHIRHVDAGSDGSEEWEVQALLNPVYDVNRLGIFFTASPRHADILLVTGAGARGMNAPLQRTMQAMPEPIVVVAVGTDAISGGLLRDGYVTAQGIGGEVPVDVWVPGSPPAPFSILHGILLALGRIRTGESSTGGRTRRLSSRSRGRRPDAEAGEEP